MPLEDGGAGSRRVACDFFIHTHLLIHAAMLLARRALASALLAICSQNIVLMLPADAASENAMSESEQLIAELLRRTEANKERNAAAVKRTTEANAFTAYDGTLDKRLVTGLDGSNRYVDGATVRELTRRRRLACAPSVMEPCREVEPVYNDAPPLQLPEIKALRCDADGRNCTFRKSP